MALGLLLICMGLGPPPGVRELRLALETSDARLMPVLCAAADCQEDMLCDEAAAAAACLASARGCRGPPYPLWMGSERSIGVGILSNYVKRKRE
jgi:hypothetical protein